MPDKPRATRTKTSAAVTTEAPPKRSTRAAKPQPAAAPPEQTNDVKPVADRRSLSVYLPSDLIERIRGAVAFANYFGEPPWITSTVDLATRAFEELLDKLEAEHNGGKPFPPPKGRLKTGPGADGIERIRAARTKK